MRRFLEQSAATQAHLGLSDGDYNYDEQSAATQAYLRLSESDYHYDEQSAATQAHLGLCDSDYNYGEHMEFEDSEQENEHSLANDIECEDF